MSGHSKWHNIQAKKGKADAARGKIFTKIGREIAIAVREGGANPESNGKLRDIDHVIDVVIIDRQREFRFAVGFGNVVCAEARRDSRIGQRLRIKAFRQRLDVLCHLCGLLLF